MNSNDILVLIGETPEKYVLDAMNVFNENSTAKHKPTAKRIVLIAAIIVTMILLMGSAIVYVINMLDFRIDTFFEKHPVLNEYSEYQGDEIITQEVLSITGLKDSPTFLASQEWYNFTKNYDPDWEIFKSTGYDPNQFPEAYRQYGLYTQAMKDKVDAILEEYQLKPLGAVLEFRTVNNLCTALGIEKFMTYSNNVGLQIKEGSYWENGNFFLNINITLPADSESKISQTTGDVWWYRKDCFSTDLIYRNINVDWSEWTYITDSGNEVLLVRSSLDWRGWIIFPRDDGLMVLRMETVNYLGYNVNGKTWYDKINVTDHQMEQVADAIDHSIQNRIVTREDVDNQAPIPMDATQNGYTVNIKDIYTNGYEVYITLSVTAPEGIVISRTTRPGYEDESFHMLTANMNTLTPADENIESARVISGSALIPIGDKDGLDNTQDFTLKAYASTKGDTPFVSGSKWNLRLEDLLHNYWNGAGVTYETLAEGEWFFEITIAE